MDKDWTHFVGSQLGEHRQIDFKRALSWAGENRPKLAADILAMSNIEGGGLLVIGVAEDQSKMLQVEGCNEEQLRTFDTTEVGAFLSQHAEPHVSLTVEKPSHNGLTVVLIRVGEFRDTPSIVVRDLQYKDRNGNPCLIARPGDVLIRTVSAQTTRVRSAEDMRALIDLSLRKTRDTMLFKFRELLDAETRKPVVPSDLHARASARWSETRAAWMTANPEIASIEVRCLPRRDISDDIPSLDALRASIARADVPFQDHHFPGNNYATSVVNVDEGVEWQLGSASTWLADRSGAFYYLDKLVPALTLPSDPPRALYVWLPCLAIVGGMRFAARYYAEFPPDIDVEIRFSLQGIKGLRLVDNNAGYLPWFSTADMVSNVDAKELIYVTSASRLVAGWELDATKAITRLFEVFNVPHAADFAHKWLVKAVPGARTA